MSAFARPVAVLEPVRDDNPVPLWLVPGDWTRGRALAHVAVAEGEAFVDFRARRVWMAWRHLAQGIAGWSFDDGTLAPCERGEEDAEPYWEVTRASVSQGGEAR